MPKGQVPAQFKCAEVGDEYWAAGSYTSGTKQKPFFMQSERGVWVDVDPGRICGTASAGFPPNMLEYCNLIPSP